MKISKAEWNNYIKTMSQLSDKASKEFADWANRNGGWDQIDRQLLAEVAWSISSKYAEGSSALAAEMYDSIANAENVKVPSAEVSANVEFGQVAKAVNGALKHSTNDDFVSSPVGRAVKQAGADTMLKNAIRDGAEFAWVPHGDTCPFCLVLASNGWRKASKKTLNGGHAEHIHTNCDCQFVIRFDKDTQVEGYDPEAYEKIYYDAEGSNSKEKIAFLRKLYDKTNKTDIIDNRNGYKVATNRQEAYSILSEMFGSVSDNVKSINEELLVENVNRLYELNSKYKVLDTNNIGYFTATPSGRAMAWTSSDYNRNFNRTNLSLVNKWYKSIDNLVDEETRGRTSFYSMPFKDEYLKTYTISHEFGHILEAYISKKRTDFDDLEEKTKTYNPALRNKEYKKEEKKQAKKITQEIIDIAKSKNPNFSTKTSLSRYGHTNDYEFFAECFANSQCGEPNELGEAMLEWLKKEGF